MQNIVELVIVTGAILGGAWAIWNKLDKIWEAIHTIRESFVSHEVCSSRREKCPCAKDIEELKKKIS